MSLRQPLVAPTPMSHLEIWTMESKPIEDAIENATPDANKKYFALLLAYKQGLSSANQVNYPAQESPLIAQLDEYSSTIPNDAYELKAATQNLKALVLQKFHKDHQQAQCIYFTELSMWSIMPVKAALCLWTNCISSFLEQNKMQEAERFAEFVLSETNLKQCHQFSRTESAVRAPINFILAKVKAKTDKNNPDQAVKLCETAFRAWPENNVIANNFAIMLSKVNNQAYLLQAEDILSQFYPQAAQKLLFVTPYYRCDVNIKLAALESDPVQKEKRLQDAMIYMAIADAALDRGQYKEPYITKGKARLAYLKANIASVDNNQERFDAEKKIALELRAQVTGETAEKKEKFARKIMMGVLFRLKPSEQKPADSISNVSNVKSSQSTLLSSRT